MADLEHDALTSSEVHEPKHITLNTTSATGKVITNSSSTDGESEYRNLKQSEIDEIVDYVTIWQADATDTQTLYWPVPYNGDVLSMYAVQEGTFSTGANTYTVKIDGTTVTSLAVTVLLAGADGDQYNATATGATSFVVGNNIEIVPTVANTDATARVRFVLALQRS